MKNTIIFLLLSLFIFNACEDEEMVSEEKQLEIDIEKIENYFISHHDFRFPLTPGTQCANHVLL